MRRAVMSAVLLAVAILVQLTIINGLRLPGGGVPDLVLVVVAALALAGGPVPGAVAGFCAGLCLDLAPPASGVIGEYALVFVIVGWALLSGRVAALKESRKRRKEAKHGPAERNVRFASPA